MILTPAGHAVIETDSHIGRWVQETGRLDHDATIGGCIVPLLNSGDWVVDCGANIGTHTIPYAERVGAGGKIIAFEVNPMALNCLRHNASNYPQVEIYGKGLSDRHERPMLLKDENVGASFLKPGIFSEEAECIPLDTLHLPRLHFMKMDCEGYELFALRGAWRTIKRYHPKLLIEINIGTLARNQVTLNDITDFLDLFGYNYAPLGGQSTAEPQYDLLAT